MQTLKIEIPTGYEIDSFNKASGEIKFKAKPQNIINRIKTIDDVLAYHNITRESFEKSCENLTPDERAYRLLKLITRCLNEGWTPNWSNSNENRYVPWFNLSSGFRFCVYWASSSISSRLYFKSKELAEHAATQFIDVYRQFML